GKEMKRIKTLLIALLVITMFAALLTACGKKDDKDTSGDKSKVTDSAEKEDKKSGDKTDSKTDDKKEEKVFTAFHAVPGTEIPDDNRMLRKIAEKIGASAKVTWLTAQTADERIGVMIAGGNYPDLITGSTGT